MLATPFDAVFKNDNRVGLSLPFSNQTGPGLEGLARLPPHGRG